VIAMKIRNKTLDELYHEMKTLYHKIDEVDTFLLKRETNNEVVNEILSEKLGEFGDFIRDIGETKVRSV